MIKKYKIHWVQESLLGRWKYVGRVLLAGIMVGTVLLILAYIKQENYTIQQFVTTSQPVAKTYAPVTVDYPFFTISNVSAESGLLINTEGYVSYISKCECPETADCKCGIPNIVLSEEKKRIKDLNELSVHEMVVEVTTPDQFMLGEKYMVSVNLDLNRNEWFPYSKARLVGYTRVGEVLKKFGLPSREGDSDEAIRAGIAKIDGKELQCRGDRTGDIIAHYYERIKACEVDSDCVAARSACSGIDVVNKDWEDTYFGLMSAASACKNCVSLVQTVDNIQCIEHSCRGDVRYAGP